MAQLEANTVKFSTAVLFLLGLIIPLWPLSLPVCWYFAYRSFKSGGDPPISLYELEKAASLLKSGAISQEEFDRIKSKNESIRMTPKNEA
jgi:hypothetical protein